MIDDAELLRRYAQERSQDAFSELVQRHVDLVYSAALRQMGGDAHRAREVTQMTFVSLALKAGSLTSHPVLLAWLYCTAGLSAAMVRRGEARRSEYERRAALETEQVIMPGSAEAADWEAARPVLDAAMAELGEPDRRAVLLRYFSNAPFSEVGRRLGLSENAARMRVERALGKLRDHLARRGVNSTAAALAAALSAQAVAAAPAGMAAAASGAALAAGGAVAVGGFALSALMSTTTLHAAAWTAAVAAGALFIVGHQRAEARLQSDIDGLRPSAVDTRQLSAENASFKAQIDRAASLAVEVAGTADLQAQLSQIRAQTAAVISEQRARHMAAAALRSTYAGNVYPVSALDNPPVPTVQIRPQVPFVMRKSGVGGTVIVDFIVGPDGTVHNAYAASSTNPEAEASVVQAVSQWEFTPGQLAGQSVATHMQVPIVININNNDSGGPPPSPQSWFPASSPAAASHPAAFWVESPPAH